MSVKEKEVLGKYQAWRPYLEPEQKEANKDQLQCDHSGCQGCGGCGCGACRA